MKEMVYAARRAETGVTPLGILILRANALPDYDISEDGQILDPDTGAIITDENILKPIITDARRQMETTSQTGEDLL